MDKIKRVKKKPSKKKDGSWDTSDLYRNASRNPFNMEYERYYNSVEGRDQIIFIYTDKETGRVCKYRFLR